jgi:hypothetical protein
MEACQRQQNKIRIVKIFVKSKILVLRFQNVYPGSEFPILDPGSRVRKIPDLDPHQRI